MIKEFKICRSSPSISHLLFADDCIVFLQANSDQASIIKAALAAFEGSGQSLSVDKCYILFSENCPSTSQEQVRNILEVRKLPFEDKYLGLPTTEGPMRKGKFQPSKDRLARKITSWAERFMSMGAKDKLIKLVVI
jgi:hypothetical protein